MKTSSFFGNGMEIGPTPARILVLLFVLACLAHAPGLWGDFTNWDDPSYVTGQRRIQSVTFSNLREILDPELTPSDPFPEYAPVRDLSLAVDYAVWGKNPFGFHLTNLLLHALNAVLLALFLHALFGVPQAAVCTALVFACHPLHAESVAWVSSRKDVLGLCLTLLSMISFFQGERENRTGFWGLSLLFLMGALLCKSQAVTVPAILAGAILLRNPARIRRVIPHALLVLAFVIHFLGLQFRKVPLQMQYGWGYEPNVAAILQVFARYAWNIFWPTRLCPYYDLNAGLKEVNGALFLSLLWLGLFVSGVLFFWKRFRAVSVSWLFFLLQLLPVLNLLPHPIWIADRYPYYGAFFLVWPVALAFSLSGGWTSRWGRILLPAILATLTLLCMRQTAVWKNSETLWRSVLERYPTAYFAHLNLSSHYLHEGRYEESERILALGLKLRPEDPGLLGNLGALRLALKDYPGAIGYLRRSLRKDPENGNTAYTLGSAFQMTGDYRTAAAAYRSCLRIDPRGPNCHARLGNVLAKMGEANEAENHLQRALEAEPTHSLALYDLGVLYGKRGDYARAEELLRRAARSDPENREVQRALHLLEIPSPIR